MPRAFILDIYATDNARLGQRKFSGLPIRLGRNALNDCQVAQNFVSDFHARIEDVQGQLAVRDLNSRNGIYVRQDAQSAPVRVRPQEPVFLGPHGFEFFVGPLLRVHVQVVDAERGETMRDFKAQGAVLGNPQVMGAAPVFGGPRESLESAPPGYAPPGYPPTPNNLRPSGAPAPRWSNPTPASPPAAMVGYEQAPARLSGYPGAPLGREEAASLPHMGGAASLPPLDAPGGPAVGAPNAYAQAPHASPGPSAGELGSGAQAPGRVSKSTSHFAMTTEALALLGLRELATSLVPGVPLETTGDIARLVTKLHDTVEVFCRCFIPLREGYAQFVSSMDLQRASMERSRNRSSAYVAVERAREPGAVATALLNWRDPSLDGPAAVEGIFADLMVHQVALLDGVMKGVRALLDELSPANIERMQESPETRWPLNIHLPGARYKALWEAYSQLHEVLEEEKQAFSRIFGPEFAQAYHEHRQRRSTATNDP